MSSQNFLAHSGSILSPASQIAIVADDKPCLHATGHAAARHETELTDYWIRDKEQLR